MFFLKLRSPLVVLFVLSFHFDVFSQIEKLKVKTETGEYKFPIPKTMSLQDAEILCIKYAKIDAIEKAFGSLVLQGNTMYTTNNEIAGKVESKSVFNSISEVNVKGEWIEDISPPDVKYFKGDQDEVWISVVVKGKVRELKSIPTSFVTTTLVCPKENCKTEVFNSGQKLIVYFKAPNNGYVAIYLDDAKEVVRLLPYTKNNESNTFEVKADQTYYFFSNSDKKQFNVDEVELFTNSEMEQNRLIILFATNDFTKPLLNASKTEDINGLQYTIPMSSSVENFQNWLQKMRSYNKNIEQEIINITIKK
jgi:hypothetical protein